MACKCSNGRPCPECIDIAYIKIINDQFVEASNDAADSWFDEQDDDAELIANIDYSDEQYNYKPMLMDNEQEMLSDEIHAWLEQEHEYDLMEQERQYDIA